MHYHSHAEIKTRSQVVFPALYMVLILTSPCTVSFVTKVVQPTYKARYDSAASHVVQLMYTTWYTNPANQDCNHITPEETSLEEMENTPGNFLGP
jgi:hypothetical protein